MDNIFQEVDVIQILRFIGSANKKAQAKILQEIEPTYGKDSPEYSRIRKVVLDEINGLTRSVVRQIFGDIEYMIS